MVALQVAGAYVSCRTHRRVLQILPDHALVSWPCLGLGHVMMALVLLSQLAVDPLLEYEVHLAFQFQIHSFIRVRLLSENHLLLKLRQYLTVALLSVVLLALLEKLQILARILPAIDLVRARDDLEPLSRAGCRYVRAGIELALVLQIELLQRQWSRRLQLNLLDVIVGGNVLVQAHYRFLNIHKI